MTGFVDYVDFVKNAVLRFAMQKEGRRIKKDGRNFQRKGFAMHLGGTKISQQARLITTTTTT